MDAKERIEQGKTAPGIEFGSTRIKGVLIDYDGNVLAAGGHEWKNSLVDGIWTYDLQDVLQRPGQRRSATRPLPDLAQHQHLRRRG